MKKGFTLIELLVVIFIIGILASVVLESFHAQKCKENPSLKECRGGKEEVCDSVCQRFKK